MSELPPDVVMDRKNLKKQLSIWKAVTIAAIIGLLFISGKSILEPKSKVKFGSDYIGSILIDDELILDNFKRNKVLENLTKDKHLKALIVNLNSGGGSAPASESLYRIISEIKKKVPVVAVMHTLAASGAYMIALSADYIVAQHTTLTGSIGVVTRSFEVTELAEKIGVKFINLKMGDQKASLYPTNKLSKEDEAVLLETLKDTYDFFVKLVSENRKISLDEAYKIADGRVYTGNQARKFNLIDEIGSKKEALEWLTKEKGVDSTLEVRDITFKVSMFNLEDFISTFVQSFIGTKNKLNGIFTVVN